MNNIMLKNDFLNDNDLYIKSYVLAKIIIFVMSSILKHLSIVRSPNSPNSNKNVDA